MSPASFPGPNRDALHDGAQAALAAREGRWEEAHAGFSTAIRHLTEQGELYYASLAGLLWDALSDGRDPDATEAGRNAVAFFDEHRASPFVERYRSAFVPSGSQPAQRDTAARTLAEA